VHTAAGELAGHLEQLARSLAEPVDVDGHLVDVAVSVGAAMPATGSCDLPVLLRAADTAMYATKHTGRPLLARPEHTDLPSINGRRAGRPGTTVFGRAA
jgi:GGDEF domain-containing protein